MWMENIYLKSNQNTRATALIFSDMLSRKPNALYLLGDVVSLEYSNRKWAKIDQCVDNCRTSSIAVHALMGNHDVMGNKRKGERNFQKRFPDHVKTGFVNIIDSLAIVMLNSNFNKLSLPDQHRQRAWYDSTLVALDENAAIRSVIVTCHHPPFSNNKLVGSSKTVQQQFVPSFIQSRKCRLFITGHSQAFEHFRMQGKDFLIIGGGGGLHHPRHTSEKRLRDEASAYKPMFHYLTVRREPGQLSVVSHSLKKDFSGFEKEYAFAISTL
jgi:3',5'-cyclic AMP phosphodiesterase CpdA